MSATILVVEDEPAIQTLVAACLQNAGHQVVRADTAEEAIRKVNEILPDVVLLDWMLPGMSGIQLARRLRGDERTHDLPIIMLTARGEEHDKIAGLDAGADDYLTKPFSVEELLARFRATLRRIRYERGHANASSSFFENGELRIDFAAGCVTVDGQEVHLAPMEYKLLCLLANNVGKVLTHKTILQAVWGNTLAQSLPSLRVFMATLRKKLEVASPQCTCIRTHVGIGYRMSRVEG